MSIYDSGYQFAWEIWLGLILGAVVLYFAIRASRKADRRHQAQSSSRPSATPTPKKRPTPPKD